ncbi:response regulator transcription factor [Streptomyces sp. 5.8]|uniref:response regulator transcription factor n=1 Tax=Streptomyces sp. 5.8 TaxID=3406571 RepID=UPI003BB4EF58
MAPDVGVLIVDDQPITRSGLTCIVGSLPGYTVVAEAEDGIQAVVRAREHEVGLALVDLRMPRVDGVEATRRLMRVEEPPRIIVMTTFGADDRALEALEAGACGFVTKDICRTELHRAMDTVMHGGTLVSPDMLGYLMTKATRSTAAAVPAERRAELLGRLNDSERHVLALVGAGLSNAQIADRLFLSVSSIKARVSRLLQKLELDNRTRAAVLAHELDLLGD